MLLPKKTDFGLWNTKIYRQIKPNIYNCMEFVESTVMAFGHKKKHNIQKWPKLFYSLRELPALIFRNWVH